MKLDDLVESRHLLLRLAGLSEKSKQLIRARNLFASQLDRLGFLCRDMEETVFLERFCGGAPPPLPFGFVEQIPDHHLADLRDRTGAAEAFENVTYDRSRIRFQERADRADIGRFAAEKMFRRKRDQVVRGVGELHWMRFLAGKIDQDLVQEEVPLGDATEAPAFVETKGARAKLLQLVRLAGGEDRGFNQLF